MMKDGDLDRYYAINLTNNKTIEFRLFRGTMNINTFIATLQLVDRMVRLVKEINDAEELQGIEWEDFLVTEELKKYWAKRTERREG